MAKPLFANNAYSTLAGSVLAADTTLSVAAGEGARFPAATTGGDYFYATLINSSNQLEIVKVTNRTSDAFTIVRAQDGTSARGYSNGDRIELRPVAAALEEIRDSERTPIDASVVEAKIDDGAVTEAKLATGAVTEAKLDTGAVTTAKIADEDVTVAKIEGGGSSTAGQVYVSDGDNTGTWGLAETIAATKDVTGTDGYVTLPGGVILQWGTFTSPGSGGISTITFPTAFTTACFYAHASKVLPTNTGGVDNDAVLRSTTTSSASFSTQNNVLYQWQAIGY